MKIYLTYFLIILLTSSCSSDSTTAEESTLSGTWRLYDAEQLTNASKSDDPFSDDADLKKPVKEGNTLCFFEDGSYFDIKGNGTFEKGNWTFSEKNEAIRFIGADGTLSLVRSELGKNPNGKQQLTLAFTQQNIILKFIKEAKPLKEFKNDPFYAANNLWRIKPKHNEDSAEITRRLTNYLKHLALILKSAKERKQDIVSFEFSMGPVKIYNGGIGIHPYPFVPDTWKNSFYDEADALMAYRKFENYLRTNRYRGAGTGNWIEDDYNILLSIYSGINEKSR